jgi:repressor LexA
MINARIFDGDVVFIRQQDMVNNGEIAAVIIEDEATLKRVYYYPEKNKLVLQAENPAYEPLVYVGEELNTIRVLGKAVAFTSIVK